MKCCICGTARNCGQYLDKVFENIEKIGELFDDYKIMIFYDPSNDNTLDKLKSYQLKNDRVCLYVNKQLISEYRTHRLAYGRNYCLNYAKSLDLDVYPFFIMMDLDDVNCKQVNPEILQNYLHRTDWDALSFNTSPRYYDMWALSIYPYCFSYIHYKNTTSYNCFVIQDYVERKLNKLNEGELLRCISAFNGFSIYRTNKFLNTQYDGHIRTDLIPKHYLKAHSKVANSPLYFYDYGNVNGFYEDCEHRAFHAEAINRDNARIMISKDKLFT